MRINKRQFANNHKKDYREHLGESHLFPHMRIPKDYNFLKRIKLDWIKTPEKYFLLEMNVEREEYESQFDYFLNYSLSKTNQHQIFGDLMPNFCSDPNLFENFIDSNNREVVYKKNLIQMGNGVSVIEKPKWKPDLIEKAILGEPYQINGKNHAGVLRSEVVIYQNIKNNDKFLYFPYAFFRKISKTPLDKFCEDPNEKLRINTMNNKYGAIKKPASRKEIRELTNLTNQTINQFIQKGIESNWDVRNAFPEKIILLGFHANEEEVLNNLNQKGYVIESREFIPCDCEINKAVNIASYGVDGFLFRRKYACYSSFDFTHKFRVELGDKEIPKLPFAFEVTPENNEKVALDILKQYHENRCH